MELNLSKEEFIQRILKFVESFQAIEICSDKINYMEYSNVESLDGVIRYSVLNVPMFCEHIFKEVFTGNLVLIDKINNIVKLVDLDYKKDLEHYDSHDLINLYDIVIINDGSDLSKYYLILEDIVYSSNIDVECVYLEDVSMTYNYLNSSLTVLI